MIIGPILGIIVILAGLALRRAFSWPENPNIDSLVNLGELGLSVVGALTVVTTLFTGMFFYAEPGFKYHVRTITGQEQMVSDTGYNL